MKQRFVRVRTRNFTAEPLRKAILTDERAICRLGSTTPTEAVFGRIPAIEVNTVEAIQNSRSKIRMKDCFSTRDIPQAQWWTSLDDINIDELPYPLVIKRVFGFQGKGMELLKDRRELTNWLSHHRFDDGEWLLEKFYNYAREYRLHVGREVGVFMSWRKLRKKEATERWFFNSQNSEWVGPLHDLFDKPSCWKAMEKAAIDALESTGLDIGAVDIRVQSNKEKSPKFIVCEINSAPTLGEMGVGIYKNVIATIIKNKKNGQTNM